VHSLPSVMRRWSRRSRLASVLATGALASALAIGGLATTPAPVAAAGTAPWYSVEVYYLGLVNCTRTGGWVAQNGSCAGYGSGRYSKYVPPLKLNSTLSAASRTWAYKLAVANACKHGDPGSRIDAAGFNPRTWGENIGCFNSITNVKAAVLAVHRMMQAEKSTNGGHWKNMKNPAFKQLGIGIWVYNSRMRVVNDFIG
jgi:uncharacterized protein YkwD